jgi:hypothetical protein
MAGPDIICASKTKDSEEVLKVSIDLFPLIQYNILVSPFSVFFFFREWKEKRRSSIKSCACRIETQPIASSSMER